MVEFVDPDEPGKRAGVHLIWANERVRPSCTTSARGVEETVCGPQGFRVLNLGALVTMKLTSSRDIDRVHAGDMLSVGPIDQSVRGALPAGLLDRLNKTQAFLDE